MSECIRKSGKKYKFQLIFKVVYKFYFFEINLQKKTQNLGRFGMKRVKNQLPYPVYNIQLN